jgi:WD40 repeat protein
LSDGTLLGEIGQHQLAQVNALAFTPDGASLTAGSTDGGLRTWSLRDESLVGLTPATGSVDAVAFSADGRFLLSAMRRWLSEAGTWDDTVHLRQAGDHTILQTLGGDRYPKSVCNGIYVNRAVFSPHGDVVATASHDQIIRLWRVADGSLLASLTGHALIITELAFSPDGRLLASSAEDGEVRLWSMATYEPVRTLPPHASGAASLTFSPNGKTLATADGAGRLHLWRVADGQPLWTVDSGKNYHSNLTFSPDGSLLAAGADDEQLHFWAAQDGALRYTLSGPLAEVKRVAFSPDGRQVAAGSVDGTVRLWAIPGRSEAQAVGLKVEAD